MTHHITRFSRRSLLRSGPLAVSALLLRSDQSFGATQLDQGFPSQPAAAVEEMVLTAHGNLPRVTELLDKHPALSKAAVDWGFGDWESALDAASHMGRADIARALLNRGARPTLFSAAMMGELDVVKAFIAASPGVERTKGAHGITLLRHAVAGGPPAAAVVEFLRQFPGADERSARTPLTQTDVDRLRGTYVLDLPTGDPLNVEGTPAQLTIRRGARSPRGLFHLGSFQFEPVGAPAVRVRFSEQAGVMRLTVMDGDDVVTATKTGG